jgi:RNA polymerase sigma-70 factor (ECF subfamily)
VTYAGAFGGPRRSSPTGPTAAEPTAAGPTDTGPAQAGSAATVEEALGRAFREDWGRIVATLIGAFGDWDLAEDCAQEAFAVALAAWRRDGVPERPRAWLITAARNRAVDRIRRARVGAVKERSLAPATVAELAVDLDALDSGIADERLRLIYTCCHPALMPASRVALALRTLCGLSTAEIARGFGVPAATMAKRLVRVKEKVALAGIPYRIPPARMLPERTPAVLAVVYLMFFEGYAATEGPALLRADLCGRAVELARLVDELTRDNPEAAGLHALLVLLHARRHARVDGDGVLVPLEEQDRTRWDRPAIAAGLATLRRALDRERPGPYQLQGLIAATHATARTAADTDWSRIVDLYGLLLPLVPSPAVRLNHAIATAMRDGPDAGLALLNGVGEHALLDAARADLLRRADRPGEAAGYYRAAIAVATNDAERRYLIRRLSELDTTGSRGDDAAPA